MDNDNVMQFPKPAPKMIWVQVEEGAWNGRMESARALASMDDRTPKGTVWKRPSGWERVHD